MGLSPVLHRFILGQVPERDAHGLKPVSFKAVVWQRDAKAAMGKEGFLTPRGRNDKDTPLNNGTYPNKTNRGGLAATP